MLVPAQVEVGGHIATVCQILPPFSPGLRGRLPDRVLHNAEVFAAAAVVERVAKSVRHRAVHLSNVVFFDADLLLEVEPFALRQRSVNVWFAPVTVTSNAGLLVGVGVRVDLNQFADQHAVVICRVHSAVERPVRVMVEGVGAVESRPGVELATQEH